MTSGTTTNPQAAQEPPQSPKAPQPGKSGLQRPRKPKKPVLTPKQALFIKSYTDRKSATFGNALQSALSAGYAQEYAEKILSVMSENVGAGMAEAMERAGLTDERLVGVLSEGLEANRVVSARIVKSRPTNIDEELAEANQNTDDFIEVPDHPTRHKFLDTAIKIKGSYAADKVEHSGPGGSPLIIERAPDGGSTQAPPQSPPG